MLLKAIHWQDKKQTCAKVHLPRNWFTCMGKSLQLWRGFQRGHTRNVTIQ